MTSDLDAIVPFPRKIKQQPQPENAVKEYDNWEDADNDMPNWPKEVYIMVSGSKFSCPPCIKQHPLFVGAKTKRAKVIVQISNRKPEDWFHYSKKIDGVPCYILKKDNSFEILPGISHVR